MTIANVVHIFDRLSGHQNRYGAHQPAWMIHARCSGATDAAAKGYFDDEVSHGSTAFPDTTYPAMETCLACPVRRECLEQAYAYECHIDNEDKVRPRWVEDGARFGIWGGIPGRVRERFAHHPDRLDACEAWLQLTALALRFGLEEVTEALWEQQASLDAGFSITAPDKGA